MYRSTVLLMLLVLSFLVHFPVTLLSPLDEVGFVIQDKLDAQHEVGQWQSQGK